MIEVWKFFFKDESNEDLALVIVVESLSITRFFTWKPFSFILCNISTAMSDFIDFEDPLQFLLQSWSFPFFWSHCLHFFFTANSIRKDMPSWCPYHTSMAFLYLINWHSSCHSPLSAILHQRKLFPCLLQSSFSHVLLHHGMKNVQHLPLLCQLLSLSFFQCFWIDAR